ncbi:hypothetical protein [Dactylosporangium cerinum]
MRGRHRLRGCMTGGRGTATPLVGGAPDPGVEVAPRTGPPETGMAAAPATGMAVEPESGTAAVPAAGDRTGAPDTGTCGTGWPCWIPPPC